LVFTQIQKTQHYFFNTLLAAPAIFIFSPLIQFFPVGLGLEMLIASCLLTVLLFGLLTSVIGHYKFKKTLSYLCFFFAFIFFLTAHLKSSFSAERPKPNSLSYYQYQDDAYWVTYDEILDEWITNSAGSKYGTGYSYANPTESKNVKTATIRVANDSTQSNPNQYTFTIVPERHVNVLRLYGDSTLVFKELSFNGMAVAPDSTGIVWPKRRSKFLLRYYISDRDTLEVKMTLANNVPPKFSILEYSYDLMSHPSFDIPERQEYMMPKPFSAVDALITKKDFDLNQIKKHVIDTTVTN